MLFSDIENKVLDETVAAGLIIHENRFTYQDKGLKKIIDLGEFWEKNTQMPIPLGGIVARRSLSDAILYKINRVMQRSVEYAFEHPEDTRPFVRQHAQEMDEAVMYQHINLYVNDYTRYLGEKGRAAIQTLFDKAVALNIIPTFKESLFLE